MTQPRQAATTESGKGRQRSVAEWTTSALATVVVLIIVGLILYDWVTGSTDPPVLRVVQQGPIERVDGQFRVPFVLSNEGGATAEAVQVIAELRQSGEVTEDGEQQIDFLSGGESEEGTFLFTQDPQQAEVVLRVASYKLP